MNHTTCTFCGTTAPESTFCVACGKSLEPVIDLCPGFSGIFVTRRPEIRISDSTTGENPRILSEQVNNRL